MNDERKEVYTELDCRNRNKEPINHHVCLSYPFINDKNKNSKVLVSLQHVRASDGIRISYDGERDGWVIEQCYCIHKDEGSYIDCVNVWEEVGFFQSWALEHKGDSFND